MFDAAVRYGCCLERYGLILSENSLMKLLHISKIPVFRNQVRRIQVEAPTPDEHSDHGAGILELGLEWTDTEYQVREEAIHEYIASSDLIYLFAEC